MYRTRGLISQCLLRTFAVVEGKVFRQSDQQFAQDDVAIKVRVLMLDAAPQALDKHVAKRTAPTVHVDGEARAFE